MAGERLLAIEDSPEVQRTLGPCLQSEGFEVVFAGSGEEGLRLIAELKPVLVLLDLMLPGMDGLEVCRQIKTNSATANLPIIMLTGKGDESDMVRGLEMGAEDYITKPFSPRVLVARIKSVLRRLASVPGSFAPATLMHFHGLTLDPDQGTLVRDSTEVFLNAPAFRFVHLLCLCSLDPGTADDEDLAATLEHEGMTLAAMGRLGEVFSLFDAVPQNEITRSAWLCLFAGVTRLQIGRPGALALLETARGLFSAQNKSIGEMLCLAYLIQGMAVFSSPRQESLRLLEQAEALFVRLEGRLSNYGRLRVTQSLALGFILIVADFPRAEQYLRLGDVPSFSDGELLEFRAVSLACRSLIRVMEGNFKGLKRDLENLATLGGNLHISCGSRILLRFSLLAYLAFVADGGNYRRHRDLLAEDLGPETFSRSLVRAFDEIVGIEMALCEDLPLKALERCAQAQKLGPGTDVSLLMGLASTLQLLASAAAGQLEGGARIPVPDACLSAYFDLLRLAQMTAAVALSGEGERALALCEGALESAQRQGYENILPLLHGIRAYSRILQHGEGQAREDIRCCLRLLRENGARHFAGWVPSMLKPLLCAAVRLDEEGAFARELARERLGLCLGDGGEEIPLLEVKTLGCFELHIKGQLVAREEEFSPTQRELFAMLISAPGLRISQEEVQLSFWPDSTPDKARSSFDSLLLRLRKVLEKAVSPGVVKDYFLLQKGILFLVNVQIDALEFREAVRTGNDCARRKECWQAGNAYAYAHRLWKGGFMSGASPREHAGDFREELERSFVDSSLRWSEDLIAEGRTTLAAEILTRAMKHDRINDGLVKALCRCHYRSKAHGKVHQVLRQYQEILRKEEYSEEEIEEIMKSFPASQRSLQGVKQN